jgi:phosphatidylglycerophosphatase A
MQPDRHFLFAHPAHFLALGFGSGLAPRAPGTAGTLAAFPLYWLMQDSPLYWPWMLCFVLLGVWVCEVTGRALGVSDHGGIVWDEIVAFLLVLPFAPVSVWGYAAAFALFRVFDIWKPFPIGWADTRVKGGLGVMLDDLLAAGYSVLILLAVARWM